ncbi:pseudouridine synthase [Aliicoccus persicus]|uniref:Pseudouridine synthase n=1 Tax=Aliicoccus persicus TaxID=930138 RepID=A0A662Z0X9_9STAP|nr:pseudouridine synthase [Aliicoccus persicus]SEV83860.1 ribosomal large subunit pseudouridine synthase B [Aliicoccus persicus]HJE20196.1 rRNA pseudouridine synthase [Aliicoccus persicus]
MERLQKVIAKSGVASRRKAEEMIEKGLVTVNGETITSMGVKVSEKDIIEVEGVPLTKEEKVYILYYKPVGEISSVGDDRDRRSVTDTFEMFEERIYPVGRLDYDTSGVLLMTNDGDFTQMMTHPKYEITKTYRVKVDGILKREQQRQFMRGIKLEDGMTAPCKIKVIRDKNDRNMILDVTLHEGRNRQVRRMFEYFDLKVVKLTRTHFDFLTLDGLSEGEYRFIKPHEVKKLIHNASQS